MQDQPATPPCVKGRRRRSELVRRETGAAESEVGDLTEERKRIGNRIMDGGVPTRNWLDKTKTANPHFFPS